MPDLHYPGDCSDIDVTRFVGPDGFGAMYQPVSAVYDPVADQTTISYRSEGSVTRAAAVQAAADEFEKRAFWMAAA